jgi:hypothetical protein
MALDGNPDETNGYHSVIKNGLVADADHVKSVVPPIGTILAWHKTFANTPSLPDGWVECNGQALNDADSPYNGQNIPDINGQNNFLRGNSTSGDADDGGTAAHSHNIVATGGTGDNVGSDLTTDSQNNEPPYMNVVWIMRVK